LAAANRFSVRSLATYANGVFLNGTELQRQLAGLDTVVSFLEEMNVRDRIEVPAEITAILTAAGVEDTLGPKPTALLLRVLDMRQLLKRRLTAARRTQANEPTR
jgi:hypothetical protein